MKISSILQHKKVSFSFEVFPPKAAAQTETVVSAALELCALKPDFISVTCGAGGSTNTSTADIAALIQSKGAVPSLAHVTCVTSAHSDIGCTVDLLRQKNIENVLALRGDLPQSGDFTLSPDFTHASDLIPLLKDAGFCVGGACYPEGHPECANKDVDLDNLKRKVDSGCDFLTTQMFFDNDMLYSFLYRAASRGINVPVIAGIMPVTDARQIKRMISLSNAYMPRRLLSIIDAFGSSPAAMRQAGIAYAVGQIIDLIINDIRGIHLYTMNKPDVARDILISLSSILGTENAEGV